MLRSTMARIETAGASVAGGTAGRIIFWLIVLTGERGTGWRIQQQRAAQGARIFPQPSRKKITTIPVGKKGRDSLRRAGFTFAAEYVNVLARVDFKTAREIANLVAELIRQGRD